MAQHVFVDESKAHAYLLVAVAVDGRDVASLRKTMRSLLLKGQSRIHFRKEQPARRRAILSALHPFPLSVTVIRSLQKDETRARDECRAALATAVTWRPASRLVIEQDDSRLRADRLILRNALSTLTGPQPEYELLPSHIDPGLWAADALAWAIQRGGDWSRRVAIHDIHWIDLNP